MFPDIKTNSCCNVWATYNQSSDGYIVAIDVNGSDDEPDDLTYFHLFCYLMNMYIFANMNDNTGA